MSNTDVCKGKKTSNKSGGVFPNLKKKPKTKTKYKELHYWNSMMKMLMILEKIIHTYIQGPGKL